MNSPIKILQNIKSRFTGKRITLGLDDATIDPFIKADPLLTQAILDAQEFINLYAKDFESIVKLDELQQAKSVQNHFINFYDPESVNPYVALAGRGPWIITTTGAVLYDAGGYGMLGMGHAPEAILETLRRPYVMANIMTPNIAHKRFVEKMLAEVGHRRQGKFAQPLKNFFCLNSGSEVMTLAARIADLNSAKQTAPGQRHHGKKIKQLSLKGSFHGRTERPAQVSDSSRPKYIENLASFRDLKNLITVAPNDINALRDAFAQAEAQNEFIEAMFFEPVMGEGNPGLSITPEFYQVARELTEKNKTLLICDAIQASIRAAGVLSIVDYPGFEMLPAPDIESYSKAINGGQYPLSVIAVRDEIAALYVTGVYGNTMTANPRALETACTVLSSLTPQLRSNIKERGAEMVQVFKETQRQFPKIVEHVQGTGLLVSVSIFADELKVVGNNGLEEQMRRHGIGVIHGGKNALRFTPHFNITSQEIKLINDTLCRLLKVHGK